jgi:glycerophosphoryl diester phosphodiesterase
MDSGTQLQSPQAFLIIAHRGASSYAPENTIAAFDLALQMGASHLELDVHLTRDDSLVVIHDDTVDRTTNGTGPVAHQTLAALQVLDAGSWFGEAFVGARIPMLAEVLTRYHGRAHLHIELKGHTAHLPQQTVDLVRAHGMAQHVTFTSFQYSHLQTMRAYAPELPAGWLVGEISDAVLAQAHALGCVQLCPRASPVTPGLVQRLHAEGFRARAWGVANEALMRQVVEAGADGMTVNFPDKLLAYMAGRVSPSGEARQS